MEKLNEDLHGTMITGRFLRCSGHGEPGSKKLLFYDNEIMLCVFPENGLSFGWDD